MQTIIKGDELQLFIKHNTTYKSIAFATNYSLSIKANTIGSTSGTNGLFESSIVSKIKWTITTENLYSEVGYETMYDAMIHKTPVELALGRAYANSNKLQLYTNDGIDNENDFWTVNQYAHWYSCKAIITSIELSSQHGDAATYNVTFAGQGKLNKIDKIPTNPYIDITINDSYEEPIAKVYYTKADYDSNHVSEYIYFNKPIELKQRNVYDLEFTRSIAGTTFHSASAVSIKYGHFDNIHFNINGKMPASYSFPFLETFELTSDVSNFDNVQYLFYWSPNLEYVNFPNLKGVTNISYMFPSCYKLTKIDGLDTWDTSKVTNMCDIFQYSLKLTSIDLSKFDTSNVTNMESMFSGCSNLTSLDVSNFDTSKVTDMGWMFNKCSNLTSLDVSNFDTSKVTDMRMMFNQCSNLTSLDLSNFDTSNVTDMYCMFQTCSNLTSLDVSNFNTSKVTDMRYMFSQCSNLTSLDVSNFNTSNVTNMYSMFLMCSKLTSLDLSNFDTSSVTDMRWMINRCSVLTSLDLSNFDTSKVTDMQYMFYGSSSLKTVKVINCSSDTQNKILNQLKSDLSSYTWTLSNGVITRS